MWQLYVYSFLAGVFGVNGLPHFIVGVLGKKHRTPFGEASTPVVNVVWGWANLIVAALLIYYGDVHKHLLRAFALVATGGLIMSLLLASAHAKNPKHNN